ncbi:hypothetical protein [Streptomyces sp. NBC_00648]|uniref:hypothetical protein n=1 Tax=Streptomyces sp. NBC_00648 TaxID=2975797 RepID=UPI0032433907
MTTSIIVTVENPAGAGRAGAVERYGCTGRRAPGCARAFAAGRGTGTVGTTGGRTSSGGRGRDVGTPIRGGGATDPGFSRRTPGGTPWGAAGAGAAALGGTGPTGHCPVPAYSCAASGFSATVAPRQRSS